MQTKGGKSARILKSTEKLANSLDDAAGVRDIVEVILGKEVTLSVWELLGLSNSLHKAFFSGLPPVAVDEIKDAQPVGNVQYVQAKVANGIMQVPKGMLSRGEGDAIHVTTTLKAVVGINGEAVEAMLDIGAEISLMTKGLAEELGLAINYGFKLYMVVQTKEQVPVVGCCEKVPIQVGNVAIKTPVMIVNSRESGFILSRPWQEAARWGCETKTNGDVDCWVYAPGGKT